MTTEIARRLQQVADDAPSSLPADGLWDRGVRRHRNRRLVAVVGTVAVLASVIGGIALGTAHDVQGARPLPADSPRGAGHLPRTIHVPAAWSPGTSEAGELGVLAAVSSSDRKRPKGILAMVAYEGIYGVSAIDGTVRFLDLPGAGGPDMPGEAMNLPLSPDGRKVAYPRYDRTAIDSDGLETQIGWSVYDSVTGRVVELRDPDAPQVESQDGSDLFFSSDSRYLLTTYTAKGVNDTKKDAFVAWDVETGGRIVVEPPGKYWSPNVGSGPGGIVWSRGNNTYTFNPTNGQTASIRTEHDPVSASFAPSGTAFAYVGGTLTGGPDGGINAPWQLYVGPTQDQMRRVPGIPDAGFVLGWRDPQHVVVETTNSDYVVVDVNDASLERGHFGGEVNLNVSMLAADLWANEIVAGVQPPGASDPRTPARRAVLLGGLVLVIGAFGAVRWRRRHG